MDYEAQLRLQAYLDGELSPGEARKVEASLSQDQEGQALLQELKFTNQALKGFEAEFKLPESREFYWSKIQREIERQERPAPAREPVPLWAAWGRLFARAGAMAAVALALFVAVVMLPRSTHPKLEVKDPGTFTYRDYDSGTTLVWLSYPAENEIASGTPADRLE